MDFMKGLFSVALVYTAFFCVYQWGFFRGSVNEQTFTKLAQNQLSHCHAVITRNK